MHHFRRLLIAIFLTLLSVALLLAAGLDYLIVTPLGGRILVHLFKQEFVAVGLMNVGHYEGNLRDGFVLSDIRITGLIYLPSGLLRVQGIRVQVPWKDLAHPDVDIFNARLILPGSDPIVFTGRVHQGEIKGNLYARSVDLHEVSRFWPYEDVRKDLKGYATNVDVVLHGPLFSPHANGSLLADEVRYKSVSLTDGFTRLDLDLFPAATQLQMKGDVWMDSGLINVRDTNLQLAPSKLSFKGDVLNPQMDIHLGAKVEDMEFHLAIKGTMEAPQLTVSSDPPMAPQDALQVLFTGNAWASSTSPFNGVTSSELAQNFLNYSLQDAQEDSQFGLKRKITNNLKLGVEMDQMPSQPGQTNVYYSRKINGELDLNDHMSLNVSQQVFPEDSYPSVYEDQDPQAETQVYLEYKKRF